MRLETVAFTKDVVADMIDQVSLKVGNLDFKFIKLSQFPNLIAVNELSFIRYDQILTELDNKFHRLISSTINLNVCLLSLPPSHISLTALLRHLCPRRCFPRRLI